MAMKMPQSSYQSRGVNIVRAENKENHSLNTRDFLCFSLCGSQTCLQTLGSWGRSSPVCHGACPLTTGSGFHAHSLGLSACSVLPLRLYTSSLKTLILPSLRLQLSLSSCCWLGSCSQGPFSLSCCCNCLQQLFLSPSVSLHTNFSL